MYFDSVFASWLLMPSISQRPASAEGLRPYSCEIALQSLFECISPKELLVGALSFHRQQVLHLLVHDHVLMDGARHVVFRPYNSKTF